MNIKSIFKKNWYILLAITIGILTFDLNNFLNPIISFFDNIGFGSPFTRYVSENAYIFTRVTNSIVDYIINFINYFTEFDIDIFLMDVLRLVSDIIIYGINYGMNLLLIMYMLYYLFISAENYDVTYSKSALYFNRFRKFLKLKLFNMKEISKVNLKLNKKKIFIFFLIILFFSGHVLWLASDTIIFIYHYFKASFDLTTHILLFDVFKSMIIFIYKTVPTFFIPFLYLVLLFYIGLYFANNRLIKNHAALKVIAKYVMSFINIITGPPGSGKTRSVVALSLASVENFIDEIQEILYEIEVKYPYVNFGEIVTDKYQHINKYPDHYYYHTLLMKQKSMIASAPFSILDPYADDFSVILDFDYIRPNVFTDSIPLEEFKVIAISELDKEYNSHYNKADVGEDGLHLFAGTVSHWMKRHGRVFIDYQQPTQVPLNIRGNAETFFSIKKNKVKYPLILLLYRLPFKLLFGFSKKTMESYTFYRRKISKKSLRNDRLLRKRFDYTFIFSLLRSFNTFLHRIMAWFDTFKYTVIYGEIGNVEGEVRSKVKLKINSRDEKYKDSYLYDSTFLSRGYENKQKKSKLIWDDAATYSSIHPSDDELKSLHSKFIDKSFFNFGEDTSPSNKKVKSTDKERSIDEIHLSF